MLRFSAWIIEVIYNFLHISIEYVVESGYLLGFFLKGIISLPEVTETRDLCVSFLVVTSIDFGVGQN